MKCKDVLGLKSNRLRDLELYPISREEQLVIKFSIDSMMWIKEV